MTIEFYYMSESGPCRAVEMVAHIVGAKLNKHYLNLFEKDQLKEDYIKINPNHKVPFIVDGDFKLGESRAIMAYLVNKHQPNNEHLYPKDPKARAKIDELLYYDIGTLYQAVAKLFYPVLLGAATELNAEDEQKFREVLEALEKRLVDSGHKFLAGNNLTIGDISVLATFSITVISGYDLSQFKNLAAYLERTKATIPGYAEINDEPLEKMKKYVEGKAK